MARRDRGPTAAETARHFRGDDWYGDDLGAARFVDCTFTDVDLREATTSGRDVRAVHLPRRSLQRLELHTATAFVGCDFRRTSFFDATLDGCKLVGSVFSECTLRPLTVRGRVRGSA